MHIRTTHGMPGYSWFKLAAKKHHGLHGLYASFDHQNDKWQDRRFRGALAARSQLRLAMVPLVLYVAKLVVLPPRNCNNQFSFSRICITVCETKKHLGTLQLVDCLATFGIQGLLSSKIETLRDIASTPEWNMAAQC